MDIFTHRLGCSHQGLAHDLTAKQPLSWGYPVMRSSVGRGGQEERLGGWAKSYNLQWASSAGFLNLIGVCNTLRNLSLDKYPNITLSTTPRLYLWTSVKGNEPILVCYTRRTGIRKGNWLEKGHTVHKLPSGAISGSFDPKSNMSSIAHTRHVSTPWVDQDEPHKLQVDCISSATYTPQLW